ncbi:MAG TPA: type II secretion system F family protein [Oscillospiraceae bacterium]|nr:type II secretion system F family protein [Oscillospiraceae bacterium]
MLVPALILSAAATLFFCAAAFLAYLFQDRLTVLRRSAEVAGAAAPAAPPEERRRFAFLSRFAAGRNAGRLDRLSDELYLAGVALRAEEFLIIWVVCGVALPLVLRILDVRLTVVLAVLILGCSLPPAFVHLSKSKSRKAFDRQLLDALTVLCNSLRAGFSFQTALDNIALELPDPIAREFRRVSRECHLGMSMEESLTNLVARSGNEDLELIVSAVVIQRQVGGNLAQVLDNISDTIRSRIKLRGDIRTLTSSGTMSGYIIGFMPIFLLVVLMLVNPSHVEIFFTTRTGKLLLLLSAAMEAVGFFFVRKIINVKF